MIQLKILLGYIKQYPKLAIILLAILLISAWQILAVLHRHPKLMPEVSVEVTTAAIKAMPVVITATGTLESEQSVAITPQVTGIIKNIAFQPGQEVKANQLLFEIDPESMSTSLQQAQALLQKDQADLISANADAKRYAALVKQEYVTQQQYDQAKAAAAAQAAVVAADEATVKQAQIQLGYTEITSPIAGKSGNVTVKQGDLVTAYTTAPLVVINKLDPLWVSFSIPQSKLHQLLKYQNSKTPLQVDIYSEHKGRLLGKATLFFIDNTVDAQTGTVLLKAELPNKQHLLWPGLMVKVNIILATEPHAIVIPVSSVQMDQDGAFVYYVANNIAHKQRITVNREIGDLAVVSNGLKGTEQIISVIPPDLDDGDPVTVNKINTIMVAPVKANS
jgi:multidrug efflux system membrane fusion protein